MRLKKEEIKTIKDTIKKFDKSAKIYLFGSRIDDNKRGGDIDILIDSPKIGFKELIKIKGILELLAII